MNDLSNGLAPDGTTVSHLTLKYQSQQKLLGTPFGPATAMPIDVPEGFSALAVELSQLSDELSSGASIQSAFFHETDECGHVVLVFKVYSANLADDDITLKNSVCAALIERYTSQDREPGTNLDFFGLGPEKSAQIESSAREFRASNRSKNFGRGVDVFISDQNRPLTINRLYPIQKDEKQETKLMEISGELVEASATNGTLTLQNVKERSKVKVTYKSSQLSDAEDCIITMCRPLKGEYYRVSYEDVTGVTKGARKLISIEEIDPLDEGCEESPEAEEQGSLDL